MPKLRSPNRRQPAALMFPAAFFATAFLAAGFFAAYTSQDSATGEVTPGSGVIQIDAAGRARIEVPITNMLPGQTEQKAFIVENTASFSWARADLSILPGSASLLTTAPPGLGLELAVYECSQPYSLETTSSPVCGGIETTVSSLTLISDFAAQIAAGDGLIGSPGRDGYYRTVLLLPSSATNALQGLTDTVTFEFVVLQ